MYPVGHGDLQSTVVIVRKFSTIMTVFNVVARHGERCPCNNEAAQLLVYA